MNERQLRTSGGLALVGMATIMVGLAMVWIPLGVVVFGILLVLLAAIVARSTPEVPK